MRRRSLPLLIILYTLAAACITGRDDPDSGPAADGDPVLADGPKKQDTGGKKDTGGKEG